MPHFPLASILEDEIHKLCQVLWDWTICTDCEKGKPCPRQPSTCPVYKLKRLDQFFKYYKNATATYGTFATSNRTCTLKQHSDLFSLITRLKEQPHATREELRNTLVSNNSGAAVTTLADVEQAIDLAAGILLMIDCSSAKNAFVAVEYGTLPTPWKDGVSLSSFIQDSFPKTSYTYTTDDRYRLAEIQRRLTAFNLKKRCGLTFEATNDLRSHLVISGNVVKIFHQVAWLKENLRASKNDRESSEDGQISQFKAVHPRQLLLETLDSIQLLLFRRSDSKSFSILQSLVSRSNFDADCLLFESASLRSNTTGTGTTTLEVETENTYHEYLYPRLDSLIAELDDPKPSGLLETWLEEKSGARYVMMATLGGVVVAVFLGMASLGVAVYQAWLGYQQWQHPVSSVTND